MCQCARCSGVKEKIKMAKHEGVGEFYAMGLQLNFARTCTSPALAGSTSSCEANTEGVAEMTTVGITFDLATPRW